MFCSDCLALGSWIFDQIASYSVMVGKITIDYISYVRDLEWTNRVDENRRIPKGLRKTVLWMSLSKTCENHGGLSQCNNVYRITSPFTPFWRRFMSKFRSDIGLVMFVAIGRLSCIKNRGTRKSWVVYLWCRSTSIGQISLDSLLAVNCIGKPSK